MPGFSQQTEAETARHEGKAWSRVLPSKMWASDPNELKDDCKASMRVPRAVTYGSHQHLTTLFENSSLQQPSPGVSLTWEC